MPKHRFFNGICLSFPFGQSIVKEGSKNGKKKKICIFFILSIRADLAWITHLLKCILCTQLWTQQQEKKKTQKKKKKKKKSKKQKKQQQKKKKKKKKKKKNRKKKSTNKQTKTTTTKKTKTKKKTTKNKKQKKTNKKKLPIMVDSSSFIIRACTYIA